MVEKGRQAGRSPPIAVYARLGTDHGLIRCEHERNPAPAYRAGGQGEDGKGSFQQEVRQISKSFRIRDISIEGAGEDENGGFLGFAEGAPHACEALSIRLGAGEFDPMQRTGALQMVRHAV